MRRLCKITLLIIIMTLTTVTASADKYSRAWKKVEECIKKDLPESAAKEINRIWDMAAKDNDGRQMLKSAVYITQVQQTYTEKSLTDGIELFKTLLPALRVQEHKALCHAFLAKGYITYLERYTYVVQFNLPTDEENVPLEHWTAKMLCDTICYHLDQSIKLAGNVSSGYYQEFFPGGNKAGQKLRPLLVDMLMDNALVLITDERLTLAKRKFLDDSRLYGSMGDFLEATRDVRADDPDLWQFYVLRQLVNGNIASKPSIRCTIDIRRMQVLDDYLDYDGTWNKNDEEWLKGVVALAESYTKKVKFSTMLYSMAAGKIVDNLDLLPDEKAESLQRQAHDICVAAQKKWPKSEGALSCLEIKEGMEHRKVSIEFNTNLIPGERNIAKLKYSNVKTAYFKIIEVPSEIKNVRNEVELLSQLNMSDPVAEWSMRVDDPGDYLEHSAFIDIPPVMQGCYYLLASSGAYFNSSDCISYEYLECNGITLLKLVENNGTLYGTTLDTRTGKPIPDCKYTVWRLNGDGDMVKVVTSGSSSADGSVVLERLGRDRYRIEMECAGQRGNAEFRVPWNSDMPERQYAKVFTDRYTYLPGDSILFSGVVYTKNDDKGSVLAGVPVLIGLRDCNWEMVDTVVAQTDSMGVFRGSFRIPSGVLPGSMHLEVDCADRDSEYDFSTRSSVNVESFRQPKFEVRLDDFNEETPYDKTVRITGKAVSYTGVPVNGAKVEWYAGASRYSCHRFCISDSRGDIRIAAGQTVTEPDGSFSFTLSVPSDIMLSESCHISVSATVTDLNGETHDANTYFQAGKESRRIVLTNENSLINRNGDKNLKFILVSNGNPVSGDIDVRVTRLMWSAPVGLPLPFSVDEGREKKELSKCVDNQHVKERFPRYDFDFDNDDATKLDVYDGTVHFDCNDEQSGLLQLSGLESGVYSVTYKTQGVEKKVTYLEFCREDDRDFVPHKCSSYSSLLWCLDQAELYRKGALQAELYDTLDIRLGNDRKGSVIHYVIENRLGVCERGMMVSQGHQQVLSIPVTDELKGSFAVHFSVLYEGVEQSFSLEYEVPDRKNQLKVEFVTFRDALEPDTPEEWKLRITDWYGNPVKAAVMLDMYDKALDEYGVNRLAFQPFSAVYVSSKSLVSLPFKSSRQYQPWLFKWNNGHEYKGKRAITGTLLDPFEYNPRNNRLMRGTGAVLRKSIAIDEDPDLTDALFMQFSAGDIAYNRSDVVAESEVERIAKEQLRSVALRTDMNPTGLFEYLITDDDGMATVRFRAPQLLTKWKIQGVAFTDSLKTGRVDTTLVTRKKLMLEPAAPRFLRQGDRMEFTAKVSNLTEGALKAVVTLTMTDAVSGRVLGIVEDGYSKKVTVPAGGNASASFTVKVPAGLTAVTYCLTAQADGHSDGMQQTLPVLSNRTQVVEALSVFNNGNEKRSFHFSELENPRSETMADEQLTLEFSASPIWYAVQALPSMIRLDDPSNLRLMHSLMGAAMSEDILRRNPKIKEMLDEWAALPASEWQTQLERNKELTGTLLEETPWVRRSNSERDRLRDLATALGTAETAQALADAVSKLINAQMPDGAWPWMDGCPSNLHITDEILQGLGLLIENGALSLTDDLKTAIQKGLDYMDEYFYKEYSASHKPESLGYSELSYLMMRSYFNGYPFKGLTRASYTYLSRLAEMEDTHNVSLWYRAQLALLMARQGKQDEAKRIAATLVERSLYDDEMGRYWRDNAGGLLWHEAPIETQALIIRTLLAVGRETEAVEAARWLLKQRQTTGWGSSPATAAAVTALMATGGNVQLESDPDITITVGKDVINASASKATAGYTTQTWQGPISRDKAIITVDSKTAGISWGAVYRSFTDELDKVEHQENGMTLKRTIWRVIHTSDGDRVEEVKAGTKLHVGDQLRIRFDLETDRNLEYLQLADMRAATVEPVSTRAGYSYNFRDDIGYYAAPGNSRNVFYIDRLSKGSYVVEYDVRVQKAGLFTVGNAVMQCLYAPAFRATTRSTTLTVEN